MENTPTCHTCGYTGDTRRFYLYESWADGVRAACENCLRLYEMSKEPQLNTIPVEDTR